MLRQCCNQVELFKTEVMDREEKVGELGDGLLGYGG